VEATGRREALDEAREAIAAWLEVAPDEFDVEA
jgi:predicted RNase H-like HicB family nuclease